MTTINYWRGETKGHLTKGTVTAAWGRQSSSLKYVNKIFATWAHDSKRLRAAGATTALKTLEDMGETRGVLAAISWMPVKHLRDAFRHLSANKGKWSDGSTATYGGGAFFGGMVSDVPWALATFGETYDANVSKMIDLIKEQQQAVKGLKRSIEGKKTIEWKAVNDPLKQFDEYSKAIEPLLVMCPESTLMKGWTYTKTAAQFTGAMDDLMKEVRKTGDIKTAAGVTALALICAKCVPVFGDLYAEAIKGVPGAIRFFENVNHQKNEMLVKAGMGKIYPD